MYNKVHDEVLEGLISAALNEYIETENKKVPDDEQLSKMYPLSKKEKRWLKRKTKEKKHNKPLVLVYLSRAAVIFLCIVSLSVAVLMTNSGVRAAVVARHKHPPDPHGGAALPGGERHALCPAGGVSARGPGQE